MVELRHKRTGKSDEWISMYPYWGSKATGVPEHLGYFRHENFGFVLESLVPEGGNGVRILTNDGRVGWVNVYYLYPVKSSGAG